MQLPVKKNVLTDKCRVTYGASCFITGQEDALDHEHLPGIVLGTPVSKFDIHESKFNIFHGGNSTYRKYGLYKPEKKSQKVVIKTGPARFRSNQ
jgi:hypothetical protein